MDPAVLPVAVDAMGGDNAPAEAVSGARQAAAELGLPVALVGRGEDIDAVGGPGDLPVIPASEVIAMDDPASAVRRMKDSSLVRAAEAVRDGSALAMVSAGNTAATMTAALLRMGRISGVARPAIATPIPSLASETPTVLLDAGANAECKPDWLVQFAQMGSAYARLRWGIERPRVGLLSIGEEPSKGTQLVTDTWGMLDGGALDGVGASFAGNVEGRDLMTGEVDVVVTDGFTGNVALKTLEGAMRSLVGGVLGAFDTDDETRAAAGVLTPALAPLYERLDPDSTGGAMLLGIRGVCVISHGSSSARAIVGAVRVASEMARGGVVPALAEAVKSGE